MPPVCYDYNLGLRFEALAAAQHARNAIRFVDGTAVSYGALNERANRIARLLERRGADRRSVIAIFQNKSIDGFAAMLACLKLGATFTNLDDHNPGDRLVKILETCRPRLIFCDTQPADVVRQVAGALGVELCGTADPGVAHELAQADAANPRQSAEATGADPAYLMFTSGSTGTPKGAVISHGGVLNLIGWSATRFGISPDDVMTNINPVYFDNSIFDFFSALFLGACLAPMPRELLKNPRQLIGAVNAAGCTVWFSVPSMLIYLVAMRALGPSDFPAMRTIVFGGEGYPKSELRKLFDMFGARAKLVNVYGPTECTCICSAHDITADDLADTVGLPSLGEICPNFDFLILDDRDVEVAPGEAGELCLLGPNVGIGYYNDRQRTSAAFCQNPLNPRYLERMYRSGDLVSADAAGRLKFVGRKDNQIKHQGYRIELEEIEAGLQRLDYVVQCGVIYRRIRAEFGQIEAFIVGDGVPAEAAIREDLKAFLPDYMVPRRIVVLGALPKNANGKVDRLALKEL